MIAQVDLLRHLTFFVSVADTRHFGEAAHNLKMTQPPLSQGIQRLERRLGVRLFERDARRVEITAAGQRLLPAARELLRGSQALIDAASQLAAPEVARVGVCLDLEDWTPRLLRSVAGDDQKVAPQLGSSRALASALHDGQLDAAVLRHPGVVDGLVAKEVHRIDTGLLLPPGLSGALDAVSLPLAVLPRHHQPTAHDQLLDSLRRAGHSGDVVECASLAEADALVAVGAAARLQPLLETSPDTACPPLRVRVVLPPLRTRRPGIDHVRLGDLLDGVLAS